MSVTCKARATLRNKNSIRNTGTKIHRFIYKENTYRFKILSREGQSIKGGVYPSKNLSRMENESNATEQRQETRIYITGCDNGSVTAN